MGRLRLIITSGFCVLLLGCAAQILQHEHADQALKVDEFDKKVDIKETSPAPPPPAPVVKEITPESEAAKAKSKKKKVTAKSAETKSAKKKAKMGPRQPDIEDSEGFEGRRPIKDPFRPGEKMTFNISYFNIVAGTLDVEVKPLAEVNGQKAYHFEVTANTNSFFSHIYKVEDKANTYLSYDDMVPLSLQISIKESKQLAEARTYFDWEKNKASYWQNRITKEHGEQSKKIEWNILPFSQNVISAPYYLRTFKLEVGKKLAFRVADEGKNIVFTGEVIRKEKLQTEIGELDTVVIKPQITVDGVFTPVGEILIWLTDDDRKFIVRMETAIKIGRIVAKLKSLDKGPE